MALVKNCLIQKPLEELKTADILQTNGVVTVTKTMVFDLVNDITFPRVGFSIYGDRKTVQS